MNKEEEQAKRLAKLQSTLESVQMPQADQNLVVYHRERRPLAEEELVHASPSGLVGAAKKSPAPLSDRLVMGEQTPQPVEDLEEVGGESKVQQAATKQPLMSNVTFEDRIISEQIFGPILPNPERTSGGSSLNETLYDRLADQVEAFRRPKGSKRVTVAVSEDVFSRVSHLAFSRELDKIDILTFLLHRHLGELSAEKIPKWLSAQSNGPNRIDFLSFVQTPDLAKTIAILQARLGINKVDIVEKLVLQWLPRAPFTVPAKQKRKATRRG
jgi:hypothetical protein